jgi:putative phage-type endonuclease
MALFGKKKTLANYFTSQNIPPTEYPYYEITNLTQGTDEWRQWRKLVIGASDAPTIMSENKFGSIQNLLDEKLGLKPEFKGNAATREGNQLEEVARSLLIKQFGIELKPTIVQDGKTPYLAASLDAIDEEHKVVMEIKCGARSYEIAQTSNPIPKYYYGQLQHILMITQLEEITYAAYRPYSKLITLKIKRDESYISRLRKMEEWFASELVSRGHQLQAEFVGAEISRPTGKA